MAAADHPTTRARVSVTTAYFERTAECQCSEETHERNRRGCELVERVSNQTNGDVVPQLRLSAAQCADAVSVIDPLCEFMSGTVLGRASLAAACAELLRLLNQPRRAQLVRILKSRGVKFQLRHGRRIATELEILKGLESSAGVQS